MRKFLITIVVLALLLVGADFALRFIATGQIGDAVQTELGLPTAPNVSISGFPFVTQAINGEYDVISASLAPASYGPVSDVTVSIDLLGVRIPLTDAIAGNTDRLTASGSRVQVSVPATSIAAAVGLPGLQITGESGGLRLSTTLTVLGQQFPISAVLDASVVNSTLELRSGEITGAGVTIPAAAVQAIGQLVNLTIPLTNLPFTITSGTVRVAGTDLVVDATTSALDFATLR